VETEKAAGEIIFMADVKIPSASVPTNPGFFHQDTRKLLGLLLDGHETVLELGAFVGTSTAFLAARAAKVLTVDHFEGSLDHDKEWLEKTFPSGLFDTFCRNIPETLREKITVYKMKTLDGMVTVAEAGHRPDLIFIDASHEYADVYADLHTALTLFPDAFVVLDDWLWENPNDEMLPTVQQAAVDVCRYLGINFHPRGYACLIFPRDKVGDP
jgi:predicted O-methyltransferase YrrM